MTRFTALHCLAFVFWTSLAAGKYRWKKPCKFGDHIDYGDLGKEIKIDGNIDAYVSYPSNNSSRGGVIIIQDIHGWELSNTRAIADLLRANNFTAILPDSFGGKSAWNRSAPRRDFVNWMRGRDPGGDDVTKAIESSIKYLKSVHSLDKITILGFCWGGRAVHHAMSRRTDLVAGVSCYGLMPDDNPKYGTINNSTLFIFGETDFLYPKKTIQGLRRALRKSSEDKYSIRIYPGMGHGFVHRKTAEVESEQAKQILAARKKIITWLARKLK